MSRPRGFFQHSSAGAWFGFFAVYSGMCLIWPELLGLGAGIGSFYLLFYVTYKAMGG